MTVLRANNILGIDTLWFTKVTEPRESIKPILEMVNDQNKLEYTYFTANTFEELIFALSKIKLARAGIIYLASHGHSNHLAFGYGSKDFINLAELGNLTSLRKLRGKGLHISSCEFMKMDESLIREFMVTTNAAFVSGYTESVDWLESSCLDILFLSSMQLGADDVEKAAKKFLNDYQQLVDRNGFVIYTRGWKNG